MYCRKCGKQVADNSEYCDECRSEMHGVSQSGRGRKKCCPKCKSRNLQVVMNTDFHSETKGGGFSAGKGCCGLMLLGPLGLLCGACGNKQKTTVTSSSTNVWVCHDCGNKFRDIDDIEADIEQTKRGKKMVPMLFYAMGIVYVIFIVASIGDAMKNAEWLAMLGNLEFFGKFLGELLANPEYFVAVVGGFLGILLLLVVGLLIFIGMGKAMKKSFERELDVLHAEKRQIETNGYINE